MNSNALDSLRLLKHTFEAPLFYNIKIYEYKEHCQKQLTQLPYYNFNALSSPSALVFCADFYCLAPKFVKKHGKSWPKYQQEKVEQNKCSGVLRGRRSGQKNSKEIAKFRQFREHYRNAVVGGACSLGQYKTGGADLGTPIRRKISAVMLKGQGSAKHASMVTVITNLVANSNIDKEKCSWNHAQIRRQKDRTGDF